MTHLRATLAIEDDTFYTSKIYVEETEDMTTINRMFWRGPEIPEGHGVMMWQYGDNVTKEAPVKVIYTDEGVQIIPTDFIRSYTSGEPPKPFIAALAAGPRLSPGEDCKICGHDSGEHNRWGKGHCVLCECEGFNWPQPS